MHRVAREAYPGPSWSRFKLTGEGELSQGANLGTRSPFDGIQTPFAGYSF